MSIIRRIWHFYKILFWAFHTKRAAERKCLLFSPGVFGKSLQAINRLNYCDENIFPITDLLNQCLFTSERLTWNGLMLVKKKKKKNHASLVNNGWKFEEWWFRVKISRLFLKFCFVTFFWWERKYSCFSKNLNLQVFHSTGWPVCSDVCWSLCSVLSLGQLWRLVVNKCFDSKFGESYRLQQTHEKVRGHKGRKFVIIATNKSTSCGIKLFKKFYF